KSAPAFARPVLLEDPGVGAAHAFAQREARLPAEPLLDQRVVAVAPVDALRRAQVVAPRELHARDLLHHVHQLFDGDELARAEVDRLVDVAVHDLADAEHAVVDVHEAAELLARAPDLDLVPA